MRESEVDGEKLAAEWHAVLCRYYRTMSELDRALTSAHGVTASEFEVLQQLDVALSARNEDRIRFHELLDRVHLSQSAMSRLITRLVNAGLVRRHLSDEDRRSMWISITPAGMSRLAEARPTHRAILAELAEA